MGEGGAGGWLSRVMLLLSVTDVAEAGDCGCCCIKPPVLMAAPLILPDAGGC